MRIISGEFRGKRLKSVSGRDTRPTGDRTREAIFNVLRSDVHDAMVLDLFAGTGALGIEALSRGAKRCVFVDHAKPAVSVIRANLAACRYEARAVLLRLELPERIPSLKKLGLKIDLAFLDPPYGMGFISPVLQALTESELIASRGRIVIEHSETEIVSYHQDLFALEQVKKYGKTLVTFMTYML